MTMMLDNRSVAAQQSDSSEEFDFRDERQSQAFYTSLDGEWHFFEKKLMTPQEVREQLKTGIGKTVPLPSSFQSQIGDINSFGTYSTIIRIPKEFVDKTLAIHVPYQYSAYSLFVDQTEVASNGVVGQDSDSHIAEMAPRIGYFIAKSDEILLTMQVSSFDHIRGGFENSIYFGQASVMTQKFNTNVIVTLFINGCIFIIGLFMLLLAWYRRKELLFFVFGMFCVLISVRALFAYPFYYTIIFSEIPWLWGTRLEYILTEASSWFYVILLWQWHKEEFSKKVLIGLSLVHLTLIVMTLFTQPVFFQALFFKVFYLAIPTFFYFIYVIYKSIRNQNRNVKVNMIGIGIIFLAFFNDFAIGKNWYQSWTLMLPATGIYVMIHVILMSKHFAQTVQETETLNKQLLILNASLDDQVHHRTLELQKANKRLRQLASIDSLTGIHNRRSFNEFIAKAFQNASDQGVPLSLLMLDIDEFKKYNDYYGHVKGDQLLQQVVKIIDNELPDNSFFARYGGEEFVIVLPNAWNDEAYKTAEHIRQSVEQARLAHAMSEFGMVTFSIGVITMTSDIIFQSDIDLIDAADQRLYLAKREGRNRVL